MQLILYTQIYLESNIIQSNKVAKN